MNLYFLFLSVYAMLITPISVHFTLRLGRQSGYSIRVRAAGLPFVRRRTDDDRTDERPLREEDVAESLAASDMAIIRAALDKRVRKQALKSLHLYALRIHARFSFADAGLTALCFATARTVMQTLAMCGIAPGALSGKIEADFNARGTELLMRGIVGARLGNLGFAAILFGVALMRARKPKQQTEEEAYAAPH